jgi:hypothetical protein
MITITADAHQEKVTILDKEIILNGPPNHLTGRIQFVNRQKDTLRLKSIGLTDKKAKGVTNDSLRVLLKLKPGEQAIQHVSHQLPLETPPGTYQKYIAIGEVKIPMQLIVQSVVDVTLSHTDFTFQGTEPGTVHTVQTMLENLGNLPFCIPTLKHAAMLDMDLMCRAFGTGFRESKVEGFEKTMDVVAENVKANMVDWVSIKLEEAGQMLEPGASLLLNVLFTIPENADAKKDYDGEFRFWDHGISVSIKSHNC